MLRKITNKMKVAMLPILFILFAVMMDSDNLLAEGRKIFCYEKLWVEDGVTSSKLYSNDMTTMDAQAWYGGYAAKGQVQMYVQYWKGTEDIFGNTKYKYYTIPLITSTTWFNVDAEESKDPNDRVSSWGNCVNIPEAVPYEIGEKNETPLPRIRLTLESKRWLLKDKGYAELVSFWPENE